MRNWKNYQEIVKRIPVKKILIWLLVVFVALQLFLFIFRNPIANYFVHKKAKSFGDTHQAEVHIGKLEFEGLAGVRVDDIFIKCHNKDTLLKVESAFVRLSFLDMLIFRVNLIDFKLQNTDLTIVRDSLGDNYSNLLESTDKAEKDSSISLEVDDMNYAERTSDIMSVLFDLLPSNITISNFSIKTDLRGYHLALFLAKFEVIEHCFSTNVLVTEEKTQQNWKLEGVLNPSENQIEAKWFSDDSAKVTIPYLGHKFSTLLSFDTVNFKFYEESVSSNLTRLTGNASVNGLILNNKRISLEDVFLNNGTIQYKVNISENAFELDSSSTIIFNQMSFHPYVSYSKQRNSGNKVAKIVAMSINKPWFNAQDLFSSLPEGLFLNIKGIKVSGELSYYLKLKIDFNCYDSLQFDTELKRRNFKILHYGAADLSKMNTTFTYTAFEHGEAVRSFEVGPGNSNFRSYTQIPAFLVNCILYSEDLGFFYHNGFSESAFRSSMITNLKAKRFRRGGSTISQQLIKNVFLNRNKTISRKVEEALIVWLIESNRLSSKQRMMEVYLNIIEWGPMVYGANEASQFYFGKDISKINLQEAIFMASIIPKPKWFRSSFDALGNLKPSLESYYKNISGRMLKNSIITQQEYDALKANVELKGPAKSLILISDSLVSDSLE